MKRLLKILSTAVTVIMLAALVALMCMGWLNISGKAFHVFGYAILRVQTGSMAPAYEEGDFLLAKAAEPSELEVGDVITFYSGDPQIKGMLNTHRITSVEKINGTLVFTTKGDASEQEDKYKVMPEDIFGEVKGSIGFLKWLAKILSIPWIFAAVIFFPMLLLIVSEARTIVKVVKQSRLNKQLISMGLDPDDPSVSALAEKYGIEIFVNAAKELEEDKQMADNKAVCETPEEVAGNEAVCETPEEAAGNEAVCETVEEAAENEAVCEVAENNGGNQMSDDKNAQSSL